VLAGTTASMAPGFETPDALTKSKADPNYWARPVPNAAKKASRPHDAMALTSGSML
jgi:hypothetical protein